VIATVDRNLARTDMAAYLKAVAEAVRNAHKKK